MMLFLLLYMFSYIFVISMDDWFLIWLGLEMNMLSFILIIFYRELMNSVESCLKYFFIQSLGSSIFMMSLYLSESDLNFLCPLILSYKMGGGPFFFWFPSFCVGISWNSCFVLMTMQKILPLELMSNMIGFILWFIILFSLIIGVLGSFNQNSMKRFLAFSSIHQVGWLISCLIIEEYLWMVYLFFYSIVLWGVICKMNDYEVINHLSIQKLQFKWIFVLLMLNMGGMPPMLGFFLKWLGFYYFMMINKIFVVFMIMMSVVMFYVYIRVCYNMILNGGINFSWIYKYLYMKKMELDYFLMIGMLIGGSVMFMFLM